MTTGIPLLLNTSFNGPDEPIVETPSNAINTFLKRNLDYLVLDNFLVSKQ
jgi:carbamoyltransferase